MEHILRIVGIWIMSQITVLGYPGIVMMMGIESACIPLPSEIIMPFSGYMTLKSPEHFSLIGVALAGAIGCVVGSVVAYFAGLWGGRPFIERYGRYILIRKKDMATADRWFAKYGNAAIFFSRLMPVIRTFISFPAGVARLNFVTFVIYTFLGSLPWCYALAYIGKVLGKNWMDIKNYFHNADIVIVVLVVLAFAFYLYHHLKPEKAAEEA